MMTVVYNWSNSPPSAAWCQITHSHSGSKVKCPTPGGREGLKCPTPGGREGVKCSTPGGREGVKCPTPGGREGLKCPWYARQGGF